MVHNLPVSPMDNERSFQLDSMRSFEIENEPTKPLKPKEFTQADLAIQKQQTKSNLIKDKQKDDEPKKEKSINNKEKEEPQSQKQIEKNRKIRGIKKRIKKIFVFLVNNY